MRLYISSNQCYWSGNWPAVCVPIKKTPDDAISCGTNGLHSSTRGPDGRRVYASVCCRFLAVPVAHALISTLFSLWLCVFWWLPACVWTECCRDTVDCAQAEFNIASPSTSLLPQKNVQATSQEFHGLFVVQLMEEVSLNHISVSNLSNSGTRIVATRVKPDWSSISQSGSWIQSFIVQCYPDVHGNLLSTLDLLNMNKRDSRGRKQENTQPKQQCFCCSLSKTDCFCRTRQIMYNSENCNFNCSRIFNTIQPIKWDLLQVCEVVLGTTGTLPVVCLLFTQQSYTLFNNSLEVLWILGGQVQGFKMLCEETADWCFMLARTRLLEQMHQWGQALPTVPVSIT